MGNDESCPMNHDELEVWCCKYHRDKHVYDGELKPGLPVLPTSPTLLSLIKKAQSEWINVRLLRPQCVDLNLICHLEKSDDCCLELAFRYGKPGYIDYLIDKRFRWSSRNPPILERKIHRSMAYETGNILMAGIIDKITLIEQSGDKYIYEMSSGDIHPIPIDG